MGGLDPSHDDLLEAAEHDDVDELVGLTGSADVGGFDADCDALGVSSTGNCNHESMRNPFSVLTDADSIPFEQQSSVASEDLDDSGELL